ncbi:MAG: hypothetical protein M4579_001120 [Chaenotheca gracillima]|nr:MAG: hypothetical protein M4579_001120 [Chaenotheca gracillima]
MDRAPTLPMSTSFTKPTSTPVSKPDGLGLKRYLMSPGPLDFYDRAIEWLEDSLFPSPQTIYFIQIVATCSALFWLLYRAWQVLNKPLPDLIDVLGLDVPAAPQVSLAGIKTDSITVHWLRPENPNSVAKYLIQINGVNVGESSRTETGITVTGLKPDHFYAVRVIAVNTNNFLAGSSTLRLKTYPQSEGLSATGPPFAILKDDDEVGISGSRLKRADSGGVRLHSSTVEASASNPVHPPITREHSGSFAQGRKVAVGRKGSPAHPIVDPTTSSQDRPNDESFSNDHETTQTLRHLTEKLEGIRRETIEVQHSIWKEEEEFNVQRDALIQERDRIKHAVKEKDEASADLKKEAHNLDRQNRNAQSQKSTKLKELQQKQNQRQQMQDDIEKWNRENGEMRERRNKMGEEISTGRDQTTERVSATRARIDDDQSAIKTLEEEIRVKGALIKEAEEARKRSEGYEDDPANKERERSEDEGEVKWEQRQRELQTMHAKASQELQKVRRSIFQIGTGSKSHLQIFHPQARQNHSSAQERLSGWGIGTNSNISPQFDPQNATQEDLAAKLANQRRNLQRQSRTNTLTSIPGFSISETRFNASPTFAANMPGSPFFNVNNGMALPHDAERSKMDEADIEQLTGGAPMSPTADLLIPSNLLGDDDTPDPQLGSIGNPAPVNPPFGGTQLSNYGSTGQDYNLRDPSSPQSSEGRPPSIFSSPRGSLGNLGSYQSESFMDNDRLSLQSNSGSLGAIGSPSDATGSSTKRFANLFNLTLNRQRGKTLGNDLPALGSLKSGQSQSFPRSVEQGPELDPIGTRRRRGSHAGGWTNAINFLNRGNTGRTNETGEPVSSEEPSQGRRRGFNMFSPRFDPLEPSSLLREPSSPRPASTASGDNLLPRPSAEGQVFGWPVNHGPGFHRSSPLGADWSVRAGDPLSRAPSRRNSVQYGSTSSLSLSRTPYDNDGTQSLLTKQTSPPAPIGTRPHTSSKNSTPRLNPAAPTFRTIFNRSDTKKADKSSKTKEKEEDETLSEEPSPPSDHKSRDSQSIHTSTSRAESRESLERSYSATPSDSPGPSTTIPKDKESIFQKITRKGSSSKFNLSRKEKGSLFSSKKAEQPPTPDEVDEEHESDLQLGRSVDSVVSATSAGAKTSLSWHSFRRRPKKGDKAASEASEKASETGEDDEGPDGDTDE